MTGFGSTPRAGRVSVRTLALVGSALGSTLISMPAVAQTTQGNISSNSATDYSLTETGTRQGGPRTIEVANSGGNVTINVQDVEAVNNGTAQGGAVYVTNTGTGSNTITAANTTATGTGPSNAINVTGAGAVTVTSTGTASANTAGSSRGISATSNAGGNATVTSNVAIGTLRGVAVSALNGNTFGGTATLTSTDATATGTNSVNAVLAQGGRVVVNSGTATNSNTAGTQGTAIFVNAGTGGALVTAGTTTALGRNQAAIQIFSQGAVDLTSGTVRTTQNSDGISVASGTDIVVRSTAVNLQGTGTDTGVGIVLGANRGGGGFNSDANGIAYTSANITSGSITTTASSSGTGQTATAAGAHGIYVTPNGTGTTTITSGAITTTGNNANGILVQAIGTGTIGGATTINSTGALQTSGNNASGIRYGGGTGGLTIANSGTITTGGTNGLGMFVLGTNGATITSNAIATTGAGVSSGMQISALAGSSAGISVTSGAISIQNAAANGTGINIGASLASSTTITSTSIANAGTGGGIFVSNQGAATGDVSITSGDITLSGAATAGFRPGIGTFQTGGTTTINSTGTITSGGQGIVLQGRTDAPAGAVSVTSNAITSNGNAIDVAFGSGTTVTSTGAIRTAAVGSIGIRVAQTTGLTTVTNAGSIGSVGNGISINPTSGDVRVTSNALTTSGDNATGIFVGSTSGTPLTGSITVANSGALAVTGADSTGIVVQTGGATTITNTGTIAATGFGISVIPGAGAVAITGTGTISSSRTGILVGSNARYAGPVTIATGGITTTGDVASAVQVSGSDGAVSVTSGPIVTGGANAAGIQILDVGGPVAVNASDVRVTGANNSGIVVSQSAGATGAVTVQAGVVRATGSGVSAAVTGTNAVSVTTSDVQSTGTAVFAGGGGAASITSGIARSSQTGVFATALTAISNVGSATVTAVDTTSAGGRGIFARGLNDASVTSGTLVASGTGSVAIIANTLDSAASGAAAGTVSVRSGTLTSGSIGINAFGPRATVTVDSTTLTAGNANAIEAYGLDVAVTSGSIVTNGSGVNAGNANGAARAANVTVTSGSVAMNGLDTGTSVGVFAQGQAVTINSGTITGTGTGNRAGINAVIQTQTSGPNGTQTGPLTINSGSITTVGNGAYGIRAVGDAGLVTVNSTGTITTVGSTREVGTNTFRYSDGITATSISGSATITSNTIRTSGEEAAGIRVEAGSGVRQNTPATNPTAGVVTVTSTGAITTTGGASTGILVRSGAGTAIIGNNGTIATAGELAAGIQVVGTTGASTVTSNAITTQGAGSIGIAAFGTTGAISLTTTGTTATTGSAATAITARTGGAISLAIATATTTTGDAVFGLAGGALTARIGTATAGGDGFSAVRLTGGTGVTLAVDTATSTGANGTTRADAIFAEASAGAIDARVGSATARGVGADAVRLIANGTGGAVALTVTGDVASSGGNGIFIDPPGTVSVNVASTARVSGLTNGINTTSATSNTIVNAGSIASLSGVAIAATGATTLDNAGRIIGVGQTAVQFGAANDTVTLRTGSSVTGAIQGGGGTDRATLIGTGTATTTTQTVATLRDFTSLTVQSGYWTAPSASLASTVASTSIASGAAFEVASGTSGITGYQTGTFANAGALVVRSTGVATDTFGATTVTGTGGVRFTGTGTATLAGTNSLTNTGTNTVDSGATVVVTGTQGGTFANNGTFQIGTGGTTGTFTGNIAMGDAATLIVNRSDSYTYNGTLTGNGTFVKNGTGQVVFGSGYAFTGITQLNGGSIRLATPVAANTELDVRGTGTVDLSNQTNTVAELAGTSTAASVNIAGGALTVNQATSTNFAGNLTGNGALTKTGSGTLNLTGTNSYTGPTTVAGGTLAVNGSIASPVSVSSGGTLGGAGTIGAPVTIASGGIFAPGNSPGTITINGNLTFAAGSTYAAEATAAGPADRIIVNGAVAINGGTVAVSASGAFAQGQLYNYNLITASGGVTGRFTNVTSNMAFLSPLLSYTGNAVNLTLLRNDVSFRALATGNNATAVAIAVGGRSFGDSVFNAILFQPTSSASAAFDQLSGEVFSTVPSVLIDGGRRVRELVLNRASVRQDGVGLWADGLQDYARSRSQAGYATARTNRTGVYGGVDFGRDGLRFGVNGGYIDQDVRVAGRSSTADVETKLIGTSIAYRPASIRLAAMGGLTHAWHDVDVQRSVSITGLSGNLAAMGKARSTEAFAELSYAMTDGAIGVSPFVRYAHDWTRADAVAEAGGAAALTVGRDRRDVGFATAGVRFGGATPINAGLSFEPKGTLSYERAFGDLRGSRTAAFAGTGPAFATTGVRLARDTFAADLGGDLVFDSGMRIGLNGFASEAKQWREYGARVTVGFRF